jgi:hypothetical protein
MANYEKRVELPGKSASEIFDRIAQAVDKLQQKDTGKFGQFDVSTDPATKTMKLKSSMVTADLVCRDGVVELKGKLSFLASAFRPKIDSVIDEWVSRAFKA